MITPRLECILAHINTKTVADIGTDHAYIPIRLVQDGVCSEVIASDIKPGPVSAAKRHIEKYGLSDKIEVRLGAGLDPIGIAETEQIIIAGMGGEMIIKILSENPEKAKSSKLVLQPMNAQAELRKFLHTNGYKITEEDIATENIKVYNIMIVSKGQDTPFEREFDYEIPPYLLSHPLIDKLLDKKIREFKKIITGNEKASEKNEKLINIYREFLKIAEGYKNESI